MVVLGPALPFHQMLASDARAGIPWPPSRRASRPERVAIQATLARVGGNRGKAAPLLRISYATLRRKIVDCGLARRRSANAALIVT
jgi:DNA-binding NtrC family response regulator